MSWVIDGVFFQLAQSGIARIWRAILPLLVERLDVPIVLLDRGGIERNFDGVEIVPFPTYKSSRYNAADSQLLEKVCRHYAAKVFSSTYYSTPIETPSLLMVYDMIPERLKFDLAAREWREKELAIAHARRHICISKSTRKDLLAFYPELNPETVTVAYCGVDRTVFFPRSAEDIIAFKARIGLTRPYFIFVGSRRQANNYKNASHFFDAVTHMSTVDFDVLCVGGEKETGAVATYGAGHRLLQIDLSDAELAVAYSGAAALVYPSKYEGFGLPVAEAMASGCPVISTTHGSLAEVAGDATLQVSGSDIGEMIGALQAIRVPEKRAQLSERGQQHASQFQWSTMADEVARVVNTLAAESAAGRHRDFYNRWGRLRSLQGEVDAVV